MTIPSLSSGLIGAAQQSQSVSNASAKLAAALAEIVSGNQASEADQVAVTAGFQSQTSGLKQAGNNLVQALSLTQVADGGISQIGGLITQLQSLASQSASPGSNPDTRKQLNQQFQQLSDQIDNIANTTSFNSQNLLDGSLSGVNTLSLDNMLGQSVSSGDNTLSIANLSSNSLFGGTLDVSSPGSAAQALSALGDAFNQIIGAQSSIGAFQQTLNFASANIDSALTNQQAAMSSISDTDLAQASSQSTLAQVQQQAGIALEAQGNNLNPALLQLVG